MEHVKHAILVASATAEVAKRLVSFVDFETELKKGLVFAAEVSEDLDVPSDYAESVYKKHFDKAKKDILKLCEDRATHELAEAVGEAKREAMLHTVRIARLQDDHDTLMTKLNSDNFIPAWEENTEFISILNASAVELKALAEKFHDDLMKKIQERHRLNLYHCFVNHLVTPETARELTNLYEVK